jgi:butyryl-CoA dehydrogenase
MEDLLTREHEELRAQVRRLVDAELVPIAERLDRDMEFPLDFYRKLGRLGYIGPSASPDYGGAGADLLSTAVIKEEVCRGAAGLGVSLNICSLNFVHTLETLGTEDQKRKYLPGVISGEKITAWMLTEPAAGSDSLALATTARPEGDHYIVNGAKTFITNGPIADYLICIARVPGTKKLEGGVQLILEKGMQGLQAGKPYDKMGMRCSPTSDVFMEDVKVPRENLVGTEGMGFREMFRVLDAERSMAASTNIGIMQACLEAAVRYAKERVQFGRPIGEFQLIQDMIANMVMNMEIARTYSYRVVRMCMAGKSILREAAMAKLFASRAAIQAALDTVQIFGGYGYIKEYHVERFLRDAKLGEIGGGTSQIQTRLIARDVLKKGIS